MCIFCVYYGNTCFGDTVTSVPDLQSKDPDFGSTGIVGVYIEFLEVLDDIGTT